MKQRVIRITNALIKGDGEGTRHKEPTMNALLQFYGFIMLFSYTENSSLL